MRKIVTLPGAAGKQQIDAGKMTTFSVRLWAGQKQRIEDAALRAQKSTPEWILENLMPATARVLGDQLPDFPPIKRRPERSIGRHLANPTARKIAEVLSQIDPATAAQAIALLTQAAQASAPRKVSGTPRR